MKSHISATIDESLVRDLEEYSREEHRSRSQIIELALRSFLGEKRGRAGALVTSQGRFEGNFEREDCYER
jgi:metal-responsive CopG/Arc/MetJ family transcriptional regulator